MTYHYRLYTYENGLGETVYRAKRKGFLGLYWWMYPYRGSWLTDDCPRCWWDRDTAMTAIRADAIGRDLDARVGRETKARNTFKIVVTEPVDIDV